MQYEKMSKKELIQALKDLRERTESDIPENEQKRLVYDLQVHQVELEMQNRELQEVQQELETSRNRYADLYDFAPVGYLTLDDRGRILELNLTGAKLLRGRRAHLIDKYFTGFLIQPDLKRFQEHLHQCRHTEMEATVELTLELKSKETREVQLSSKVVQGKRGRTNEYRTAIVDISERKHLQEEVDRARRLEAAGRVAGQIAHDFNNLLSPLVAYPSLITEMLPESHPARDLVAEMADCVDKIAQINQQLLALGRRGHYVMEPVDFNYLVQRVIAEHPFPPTTTLETRLAPDLLPIKGGKAQLTRALSNLLHNAEEAMSGSGTICVQTRNLYLEAPPKGYQTVERGEYVRLDVRDTGGGIESEIADKIFDPFFTTKAMDRLRGSGLGLSVVRGIVEDHHGYITVASECGAGTTFSLYFPITRESIMLKESDEVRGGDEHIMIVDDDPVQRKVMSTVLNHLGYTVHVVASGEEAIEFARQQKHDLILLDMVMDGLDGTETYREILKDNPKQKAIILSGYAMSERVQEALELGASTFIMKPVALHELATTVRRELDEKV